jgi:hypothetical protein
MTQPPVGTMTTEQARECVLKMSTVFLQGRMAGEGQVAAVEAAMDAIRQCGREARREAAKRDYRLMWTAAQQLRREAQAATVAPRTLGRVPADETPAVDRDSLSELEKRAAPGRYAIREVASDGQGETINFYKIEVPAEGRWAGYVFVKQITGHVGEDGVRVRHPARRAAILAAIEAAGPVEAERLYGQEIGRCSRCGRVLTNDESRAYGIGPECRQK